MKWPKMTSPSAGSWGLAGAGVRRPASVPVEQFSTPLVQQLRPGEGSVTGVIPSSGELTLYIGPEGMAVWSVTYVAISTTTGAADTSVAYAAIGPIGSGGIGPAGTAYNGGGDTISMGGASLLCGEYIAITWAGAHPTDQAIARVYGEQQVLT